MNKFFILLILIFEIKSEDWYDEVNGHNTENSHNGYAGWVSNYCSDFYLCSERKYRVHYLKEDWSEEFTACQPAGDGRVIDGLAISGGLEYQTSYIKGDKHTWLPTVTGYDINDDNNGYAGYLSYPLYCSLIYGDEYYRSGYNFDNENSSNEKKVAERIIKNFFGKKYNYEKEKEIYSDKNINIQIILLNTKDIKFNGNIEIRIEEQKIKYASYSKIIDDDLIYYLNKKINFNINKIKNFLEYQLLNNGISNGNIAINFDLLHNLIEIDIGSKITKKEEFYRGGFRFNIYLKDEEELLSKIKKIVKILFRYFGRKITPLINEILSNLNTSFSVLFFISVSMLFPSNLYIIIYL